MSPSDFGTDESIAVEQEKQVEKPRLYKVLLHNDHYTTMEFVVFVLESVFRKTTGQAVQIMLNVHQEGMGIAGVFTSSVAETKVTKVHELAEQEGFPLKCSVEPE